LQLGKIEENLRFDSWPSAIALGFSLQRCDIMIDSWDARFVVNTQ
jgi:hypothetical protein